MTDSDYFKREQKFQVLNRSMSVISDYYDTTTENKEEALRKIAEYIKKMYEVTFVYQRQSLDLGGAIRSLGAATGTRQWCINLINSTKETFVNELKQIAVKHDDKFVREIIAELDSNSTNNTPEPASTTNKESVDHEDKKPQKGSSATVLGIIGIIVSWLFAIAGHIVSIVGIINGVKEYKRTGKKTGLTLSIIGEACAVLSSLIGIAASL